MGVRDWGLGIGKSGHWAVDSGRCETASSFFGLIFGSSIFLHFKQNDVCHCLLASSAEKNAGKSLLASKQWHTNRPLTSFC
jgi:hypothetical protein